MESVSSSTVSTENITKTASVATTETETKATGTGEFEKFLRANLAPDASNKVSEEELFAAIMPERLKTLKGEEAATKFGEAFEAAKGALKKADGYVPFEDAAKQALQKLVTDGVVSADEADSVYATSFAAAQLDTNTTVLYDNKGGGSDPTIAMEDLEKALLSSRLKIEAFDAGTETVEARKLSEPTLSKSQIMGAAGSVSAGVSTATVTGSVTGGTVSPNGTLFDGEGNFLFKPEAGDGRLAILSPDGVGPLVESIALLDKEGNVIEEGRFTSFGDDGRNRAKYSFTKPGGSYQDDIVVQMKFLDGTIKNYEIPDPGKRYD